MRHTCMENLDLFFFLKYYSKKWVIEAYQLVPVAVTGMFGGFIRIINKKKAPSLRQHIAGVSTALFAALITWGLLRWVRPEMDTKIIYVCCLLAGFCCYDLIGVVKDIFLKRVKKILLEILKDD